MFRRLPDTVARRAIAVTIDGAPASGFEGDTVASVLLAAGVSDFRTTPVIGSRRGPF